MSFCKKKTIFIDTLFYGIDSQLDRACVFFVIFTKKAFFKVFFCAYLLNKILFVNQRLGILVENCWFGYEK